MQLNRDILSKLVNGSLLKLPPKDVFGLPEKVLQFGTGVLLRGLPDYFIDKANRHGIFNGRVVVVKSTASGSTDAFEEQNGLYTQVIRGIEYGKAVEEYILNSSISRVLSASYQWRDILDCAHNPEFKIIISNTTEVGISLQEDEDIWGNPPSSFPGKLLAFLMERYKACDGHPNGGFVIVPTELIPDNGDKLKHIVTILAHNDGCDPKFIEWVASANDFCNSLVDRIIPGRLSAEEQRQTERLLGYEDALMIQSEVFRLWAIETPSPRVKEVLTFAESDDGVVLTDGLEKFRELKLRLLNGTHTASCALAFLAGFETVGEAMEDKVMGAFIRSLAIKEIAPAIVSEKITLDDSVQFAQQVFDRFRNPFLAHKWISIAAQYTSKMKMRVLPLVEKHYVRQQNGFNYLAIGVAAYLHLIKLLHKDKRDWQLTHLGCSYSLQDDSASRIIKLGQHAPSDREWIMEALNNEFWEIQLNNDFIYQTIEYFNDIKEMGAKTFIKSIKEQKIPSSI